MEQDCWVLTVSDLGLESLTFHEGWVSQTPSVHGTPFTGKWEFTDSGEFIVDPNLRHSTIKGLFYNKANYHCIREDVFRCLVKELCLCY